MGPMTLPNPTRATSHIGPKSAKQRSAWLRIEAESKLRQSSRRLAWRTAQDLCLDLVNRLNNYADSISSVPKCDTLKLPQHDHSLISRLTRQTVSQPSACPWEGHLLSFAASGRTAACEDPQKDSIDVHRYAHTHVQYVLYVAE